MGKYLTIALASGVACCSLTGTSVVFAQALAPVATADNSGLEEIIVTARRKEEKLQSVPLAITAFSQETLDDNRIATATDLQHLVPSLEVQALSSGAASFYIRGQGSSNAGAGGLGAVVEYFDEVPFNATGYGLYYDMENIQVLKGPQGTLFGRNTTGGAVLFELKKPTNNFEGYAQLTLGDYDDHEIEGAINIPIVSDKLLVRVAGDRQDRDGYTKDLSTGNDLDGRDFWAARVSVTFRPVDTVQNDFVYDSYYSRVHGSSVILAGVNAGFTLGSIPLGPLGNIPLTLGKGPGYAGLLNSKTAVATAIAGYKAGSFSLYPTLPGLFAQQQALGPRVQVGTDDNPVNYEYRWGFTDILRWDLSDDLTFRNIAAYRDDKSNSNIDFDGTSLPIFELNHLPGSETDIAQYTEEAQFQGKSLDGNLSWVAGGFLLFDHPNGGDIKPTLLLIAAGAPSLQTTSASERSQALYAQGTYDLSRFVDGLKFTGGYRYTWDWRTIATQTFSSLTPGVACGLTPPPNASCTAAAGGAFHGPSWTIGLDYQLLPQTLVYVESRHGYKSGGLNQQSRDPSDLLFKPESVTDVEIGLKSDWDIMGVKARTNVDAYHQDYSNIQLNVTQVQDGLPVTLTKNAATATIEGVEFEGSIIPFKSLEIDGTYAYGYAKYDQFTAGANPTAVLYNGLPLNQYSISARYHLPINADLGDVSFAATYNWRSHEIITTTPDPFQNQDSYGLLNLSVDWKDVGGRPLDVSFFVTNVTDKTYALGDFSLYNVFGFSSLVYGEPRMWGVQLRYRFGPGTPSIGL